MTNTGMFFRMLFSAVFRRRSRAVMAVVASLVGAATLFCLAMICLAVPQQMNEEMRAYGANLIVTPTESTNADGKAGIDKAMVQHTTEMVKAKGSAKYATYRYENVRVNASPYVMAGVNAAQVKNLNHHWVVDGSWPTDGKVLVGRDIADAIGLRIGSAITIGYRASDNASTNGTSSNSSIDQQTKDGRVSSDIMDTSGTEFRVAGIVDTGGSEDSIIYATNADVNKLTGITRGVDVIEYSAGASDLAGLVFQHQRHDLHARQGTAGHQDHRLRHPHHHHAADAVLDRLAGGAGADARRRRHHNQLDRLAATQRDWPAQGPRC